MTCFGLAVIKQSRKTSISPLTQTETAGTEKFADANARASRLLSLVRRERQAETQENCEESSIGPFLSTSPDPTEETSVYSGQPSSRVPMASQLAADFNLPCSSVCPFDATTVALQWMILGSVAVAPFSRLIPTTLPSADHN